MVLRAQPGAAGLGAARRGGRAASSARSRSASSRMSIGDESVEVGMPSISRPTPPTAAAASSASCRPRTRSARATSGVPLLLTVPNAASAPHPDRQARLDAAAAAARLGAAAPRGCARRVERSSRDATGRATACCATPLAQLALRRRAARVRRCSPATGTRSSDGAGASASSRRSTATCSPTPAPLRAGPRRDRRAAAVAARRYLRAGFVPTPKTFTRARQVARPARRCPTAALRARRPRLPVSLARLRHAAGRSRAPGARGDGAEDPRARASASTRSSCSPQRAVAGALPENCRVVHVRRRLGRFERGRSFASALNRELAREARSRCSRT